MMISATTDNTLISGKDYYLQDHLGSPIRLLGDEGDMAQAFDEFGVPKITDSIGFNNPFGFTGYQTDTVSGLQYAQARYYNPVAGRFTAEDPLKDRLNWYGYCNANPINFIDPLGLFECDGTNWNFATDFSDSPINRALLDSIMSGTSGTLHFDFTDLTITASGGSTLGINPSPGNIADAGSHALNIANAVNIAPYVVSAPRYAAPGSRAAINAPPTSALGTASRVAGGASVVLDVGMGVHGNVQNSALPAVIAVDAGIDLAFSLGGLGTAAGSSAAAGKVFGPKGKAIAGFLGGMSYLYATDVLPAVDEKTIREWSREQIHDFTGVNGW